jgi:guanyl-specific ribonuclease Sa
MSPLHLTAEVEAGATIPNAGSPLKPRRASCHHGRAMRRTGALLLAALLVLAAAAAVRWGPGSSPEAPSLERAPAAPEAVPAPLERARQVLAAIEARGGEPLDGYVGGRTFHNRERRLPPGRYREYDVHPRVPGRDRGPERLVVDQATGRAYYTGDHYRSFVPLN